MRSKTIKKSSQYSKPLFFSKKSVTEIISEDPINYHKTLQSRLKKDGMLASFPEFKEPVYYLQSALQEPEILDLAKENKHVQESLFQINNDLFHLNLNFTIDGENYPHTPPCDGHFPYLPTLMAIEKTLGFLDSCYRTTYTNIPPLYHANRYKYHSFGFYKYDHTDNPIILLPTADSLTLDYFIKTRSIPIGCVGVSGKNTPTVFADAYNNTPLDFWLHDINHNRRYQSYNALYLKKNSCTPDDMYKHFDAFTQHIILPSIEITPNLTLQEKYLRQIMRVLYFELLHEYALTPDKQSIQAAFLHSPGAPSPFEHMINPNTFHKEDIEKKLRMKNNNINSGFSFFEKQTTNEVTIRYFFDKGPNFLTSAYNKLINGFYDTHYHRDDCLPPFTKRTVELFIKAAQQILIDIDAKGLKSNDEIAKLLTIVNDKNTFIEKYPNTELQSVQKNRNKKPGIEDAISLFKKHSGLNIGILGVKFYPDTTNYVYLIETEQGDYTVKIYNDTKSHLIEEEIYAYQMFLGNPMVKSLLAKEDNSFIITTHVEGKTIKELIEKNNVTSSSVEAINSQVFNFISNLPLRNSKSGFGKRIKNPKVYKNNWYNWLEYFFAQHETKLQTVTKLEKETIQKYVSIFKSILKEKRDYLVAVKPHLIFIDLNLSNFILSENNKLTFIDLELLCSGDLLLAYGEWVSQIYGTELFENFKVRYLSQLTLEQNQMIHMYAFLGNLISLIDMASKGHSINTAHPWGNPNNLYISMMDAHLETLRATQKEHITATLTV